MELKDRKGAEVMGKEKNRNKKTNKQEIDENTTLAEVYSIKGSDEVLRMLNVPCVSCSFAVMEMDMLKLGDICDMYGLDKKKVILSLRKLAEQA